MSFYEFFKLGNGVPFTISLLIMGGLLLLAATKVSKKMNNNDSSKYDGE